MDPMIVQSYQVGIGIGLILLSTLILFPGTTTSFGTTDPNTIEEIHQSRNQRSGGRNAPKSRSSDMKNKYHDEDDDAIAAYWTPHRQLNMFVYACILVILCFVWIQSYQDHTPLVATTHTTTGTIVPPLTTQQEESIQQQQQKYKQQLQHPTTLLKLFFQTYFPKEASVFFGGNRPTQGTDKQQGAVQL
jgi:preprotein translocase subunit SecY